jgi:hypothetical protein
VEDHAIIWVRHKPFSGCNYVQTPIAVLPDGRALASVP